MATIATGLTAMTCGSCGKEVAQGSRNNICGGCKSVRYCGKDCQKAHWKSGGHKALCKKPTNNTTATRPPGVEWSVHPTCTTAPTVAAAEATVQSQAGVRIEVGCEVRVSGLVSRPELNGAKGHVKARQGERWVVGIVRTGSSGGSSEIPVLLKPASLTVLEAARVPAAGHPGGHSASKSAIDDRAGVSAACWVCLDREGVLLHGGCACRSTSGHGHVECVAAHAEAHYKKFGDSEVETEAQTPEYGQ
jgi:hypothetical protein